jgi:hypothetical protein
LASIGGICNRRNFATSSCSWRRTFRMTLGTFQPLDTLSRDAFVDAYDEVFCYYSKQSLMLDRRCLWTFQFVAIMTHHSRFNRFSLMASEMPSPNKRRSRSSTLRKNISRGVADDQWHPTRCIGAQYWGL